MTPRERPKRIQRKRTKGFKLPEGCVYVGRPTKFGNPFIGPGAVDRYRRWLSGLLSAREWSESVYADDVSFPDYRNVLAAAKELRGKDLACWCKLSCECHADVLLELANPENPQ